MSSLELMSTQPTIYLDYAASTPCDPKVLDVMNEVALNVYANASSGHEAGRAAARIVEQSRETIAEHIGALPHELVFTSGATESNNLAIQGLARYAESHGIQKNRIVCCAIEHSSVLEPARFLQRYGFEVDLAPVNRSGTIDLAMLEKLITKETLLVCVQLANNEIGTIQPISKVADIAHRSAALLHCDAAQALGKIPVDVGELGADFVSFSAHKCYGPKGVGALWISGGVLNNPIEPLCFGGGHESGLRSGTFNSPGIAGFSTAIELAIGVLDLESHRLESLRHKFEENITKEVAGSWVNAQRTHRVPNISSVSFPDNHPNLLNELIRQTAVSKGSACHFAPQGNSHVLTAIGLSNTCANNTLRFSFGSSCTRSSIDKVYALLGLLNNRVDSIVGRGTDKSFSRGHLLDNSSGVGEDGE